MIANDNRYSTMVVPTLPNEGDDLGAYDGASVQARLGYSAQGDSAADDFTTGLPTDQGAAFPVAPMSAQGGNDDKQQRLTRTGPAAPAIIGLVDSSGHWVGAPQVPQQAGTAGLQLARAGAPTDDGRLPTAVLRDGSSADTWRQLDDGMGMKHDSAPPLAYGGIISDSTPVDGVASPGGSLPITPAADPVQVNTYRVPPTPWDEYNYLGGPFDG